MAESKAWQGWKAALFAAAIALLSVGGLAGLLLYRGPLSGLHTHPGFHNLLESAAWAVWPGALIALAALALRLWMDPGIDRSTARIAALLLPFAGICMVFGARAIGYRDLGITIALTLGSTLPVFTARTLATRYLAGVGIALLGAFAIGAYAFAQTPDVGLIGVVLGMYAGFAQALVGVWGLALAVAP